MENNITFDESKVLKAIEDLIIQAFKVSVETETEPNFWYDLFEKKDIEVIKENYGRKEYFPCFNVEIINPIPYIGNNTQIEEYTQFDFEINCYNQKTKTFDKRSLGLLINMRIKKALQEEYGFEIDTNQQMVSPDDTIYRRVIRGKAVYHNSTDTFYRVS